MRFERTAGLWRLFTPFALGLCALCTGAALIIHIIAGLALPLAVGLLISTATLVAYVIWHRSPIRAHPYLSSKAKIGASAGGVALLAYDTSKFALSTLDPGPYNPFEAIRIFGLLLTRYADSEPAVYAAGIFFHAINGILFGVAYSFLVRRHDIVTGILWGLGLEVFQLTLYPGWLDIRFYSEFANISAMSHVAYGAVLGYICRSLGQRHVALARKRSRLS